MAIVTDTRILGKTSKRVTEFPISQSLITTMIAEGKKGRGISAVQIGILAQIILIWTKGKREYMLLVNPKVLHRDGSIVMSETCLSRPGVRVKKTRPTFLHISAQDANGEYFEVKANLPLSRVLDHELDHLNGIYLE